MTYFDAENISEWFCPGMMPDYALRCVGDCMKPTVNDGDYVLIRRQSDFTDGQIIVVAVDGWKMLKRAYKIPGGVRFVPDNPAHKPFTAKTEAVKIYGIAVARGCQQS